MKRQSFKTGEMFTWRAWGGEFVNVNEQGHLEIVLDPKTDSHVDLHELLTKLREDSVAPPVLVRFPQLIDHQITKLNRAFADAIRMFHSRSTYTSVYPLKVNGQRTVVSRICQSGRSYGMGLEVGTKPELCIALSLLDRSQGPIICNGYKDASYMELAGAACAVGYDIVVVFERPQEYEILSELAAKGLPCPNLGVRVKLNASGMGRWEESSGDLSKFGLTASELLDATRRLRECKLLDSLKLMHFHLGSQITHIRNFKQALSEALRFYVELKELGVPLDTMDVGGGLGVDYDGSNSSADSSVNYNVQEYANDVIYTTKEVLDRARIPEPRILTETGRFLVAHHAALLIEPLNQRQKKSRPRRALRRASNVDAVNELEDLATEINSKNWREYLHDAYQKKDEMLSAFTLGFLSLDQRAQAESAFTRVVERASRFARNSRFDGEDKAALERIASRLHAFNFSIFKSLPDSWILDMLFPIIPTSRLKEKPLTRATIADLTCDSDGVINKFAHPSDVRATFDIHSPPWDNGYALAVLLVGAYQEALGSDHNLFGRPSEVTVEARANGKFSISAVHRSANCASMLAQQGFADLLNGPAPEGSSSSEANFRRILNDVLAGSTYLDPIGQPGRAKRAAQPLSRVASR